MNLNTYNILYHQNTFTHMPQMNTPGKLNNTYGKLRSALDLVSTPYHKKVHKVNYKVTNTIYDNFPEHVPIPKWDIKWPHTRINHPRVPPQSRLQQVKNHIRVICTGLYMHRHPYQEDNSRRYCTAPSKQTGRTLFHVTSHLKTAPHIHMDITTNYWTGNT